MSVVLTEPPGRYLIALYFYAHPEKTYALIRLPRKYEWLYYVSKKQAYFNFAIPAIEPHRCETCDQPLGIDHKDLFICPGCEMNSFFRN